MSYLQDRKTRRAKFLKISAGLALVIILFYFQSGIMRGLSYGTGAAIRPLLVFGGNVAQDISGLGTYFRSKTSLQEHNDTLKAELLLQEARMANHAVLEKENAELKEMLGSGINKKNTILAAILSKPNRSPYDTIILDAGEAEGLTAGDMIYASGDIPLGRVSIVSGHTSKAILFSSAGEKIQVVLPVNLAEHGGSDVFWELSGRGGGNFEMTLPREFVLNKGDTAVLPGRLAEAVAVTETVLSDPRDSFKKALLKSPINVQNIKFVEVRIEGNP